MILTSDFDETFKNIENSEKLSKKLEKQWKNIGKDQENFEKHRHIRKTSKNCAGFVELQIRWTDFESDFDDLDADFDDSDV